MVTVDDLWAELFTHEPDDRAGLAIALTHAEMTALRRECDQAGAPHLVVPANAGGDWTLLGLPVRIVRDPPAERFPRASAA